MANGPMSTEISWALQAYRLSNANPARLLGVVALALLTAVLDAVGMSVFLPLLVFMQGGVEALATKLPFPFDAAYAAVGARVAGYELITLMSLAISLLCLRYWIAYVQQKLSIQIAAQAVSTLRRKIHLAFLESDINFHVQRHAGTRYTAVYTYAQQVGGTIIMLSQLLVALLVCAGYAALLFYIAPQISLAAIPVLAVILLAYRGLMTRSKQAATEYNIHMARLNDALTEQLQGVRPIKLHNREAMMADKFARITDMNLSMYSRVLLVQAITGATINPVLLIAGAGLIYVSLTWFNADLPTLGTFAVVLFRMLPLLGALNTLRTSLHAYGPSLDLYQKALHEAQAERAIRSGGRPFDRIAQQIAFDRVTFKYPNSSLAALDNVSLSIPAGLSVAIVGRSGAGKSTIVDLMARLYDPSAGSIIIDGVPLSEFDLGSLRRSVALVSQDSFLFDATIRENVSFGLDRELDDAAMESVLHRAHALEFVRALPDGFDAVVGERGVKLSGGQRQRLALARALAIEPSLLVLDEPTSALDSESEQAIQQALMELRGKITMVIVAHRFATIRDSDLIHVLKDGKVIASGTHTALWQENEHYRHLSELQAA